MITEVKNTNSKIMSNFYPNVTTLRSGNNLINSNSPLVMTAQTMSLRYEPSCNGFSAEKAHYLVTEQNDLCCFIGLTFKLSLKLSFSIIRFKTEKAQLTRA